MKLMKALGTTNPRLFSDTLVYFLQHFLKWNILFKEKFKEKFDLVSHTVSSAIGNLTFPDSDKNSISSNL